MLKAINNKLLKFNKNILKTIVNSYKNQTPRNCPIHRRNNTTSVVGLASYTNLILLTTKHCLTLPPTPITKPTLDDFDLSLQEACNTGEGALLNLLDVLKECVTETGRQYRDCLVAQLDIIETASRIGPLCEQWDDLPEFRVLAADLRRELIEYATLIKTVGQMIQDQSIVSVINGEYVHVLAEKFGEIEAILQREIEANRRFDADLLQRTRDNIVKST